MKAVVAAFNQEKALEGAFSVIIQPVLEPMDRFTALIRTGSNVTAWTLDKHSTNPHDAFFYIECICNAWFSIEIIVRLVNRENKI